TLVCTWGGTPDAPTGVITFSPGVTDFPSTEPIEFTATGELGGGEGCTGVLTFRGVADPGTSCLVGMPLHATATGFPPIAYVEGTIGVVGTARPLAVPLLALQREGALGARLEGHRARAPLAPARLPRPARPLDDGAEGAAGPRARRRDDPRLDAQNRAPRAPAARAGALPG